MVRGAVSILGLAALVAGVLLLPPQGGSAPPAGRGREPHGPFVFLQQTDAVDSATMACPAHCHGTPTQAREKLKGILAAQPKATPSSVYVCRVDQAETLAMFAPLVDRVVLNAFLYSSDVGPASEDAAWPGLTHPYLNRLRQLRATAGSTELIAAIDLSGEEALYLKRKPSFDEVKWMTLAAIGSDFDGIAWRGRSEDKPWSGLFRAFVARLGAHTAELGQAEPVGWVAAEEGTTCSALASPTMLFVVVLSPDYLRRAACDEGVAYPLSDKAARCRVTVTVPPELRLQECSRLSGEVIQMAVAGSRVEVDYRLHGPGDILCFRLAKQSTAVAATP